MTKTNKLAFKLAAVDLHPATPGEKKLFCEWERTGRPYPWGKDQFTDTFVLTDGGGAVGYVSLQFVEREVYIKNIMVSPGRRRQKWGTNLLERVLKGSRSAGASAVFLDVDPRNEAAVGLYQKVGFKTAGRRPNAYPKGESSLLMKKILALIVVAVAWAAAPAGLNAATDSAASAASTHYLKALLYESQGNLSSAQGELRSALELEPESAHLNRMMAEVSFFLGQLKDAKEYIDVANELDPDDTKSYLLAGQIYWSLGNIEIAEEKLRRAVALSPDESQPLVSLAMALTVRDPQKAIDLYRDFLKRHPNATEIQERLAQLYRSQGDLKASEKTWKKVLEGEPDNLRANLALAQLAEVDSDTHTAIAYYEAVLDKDPDNLALLLRVGELRYRNNEMKQAFQAFSQAKKIAPESASANFWMAILHEHRGEWKDAINLLEKVSKASPEPGVRLRLAYYYTQDGQHAQAVKILKNLSKEEPENTDFLNYLAIAYEQLKDYRNAANTVEKLVDLDPLNPEYKFFEGTLYDRMKNFSKAEASLKKAIELDPQFDMALNYLGYSYADRNEKLDDAESLLIRALEIEPDKSAYLDSLGWIYYRQGKYGDAERMLLKAAESGHDPLIWEHLGDVYVAQGNTMKAVSIYDRSFQLDSNQKDLLRKTKKIISRLSPEQQATVHRRRNRSNYRGIRKIEGLVEIRACRKGRCFENKGELNYEINKELSIQIPGPLAGPVLMVKKSAGKKAQFGAVHPVFQEAQGDVVLAVERINSLLNGSLFGHQPADDLSFKNDFGLVTEADWPGGPGAPKEFLKLSDYKNDSWPRVPYQITWKNRSSGFSIDIRLKGILVTPVSEKTQSE